MWSFTSLVWAVLTLTSYASRPGAKIYIFDDKEHSPSPNPPSISSETTGLLLAQRLGVSQFHSLKDVDESTLSLLNGHGGPHQSIFADGEGKGMLIMFVEGVTETGQ